MFSLMHRIETKMQLKTYSQILSLFCELNKGTIKYDWHIYRIKCIKYIKMLNNWLFFSEGNLLLCLTQFLKITGQIKKKKKKVCKFNHVDDDCCIFKIKLRIWCMFMYFGKFHLDINLWFGTYAS